LADPPLEGRWLFPILVAQHSLFYLYKIRINDYYFAMQRFMPVVVPSLLARRGGAHPLWARGRAGASSVLLATAITVLFLRDTLPSRPIATGATRCASSTTWPGGSAPRTW
jgi:hypothetical protein